jgi:outer membrane protein assembly factor BamB
MKMSRRGTFVWVFVLLVPAVLLAASQCLYGADWNQWRGPGRNGVAEQSPALIDEPPPDGVPLLWQRDGIPSHRNGGYSSVVIVDGLAYVYVAWLFEEPVEERRVGERDLRVFGYPDVAVPAGVVQKIDEARLSDERAKLKGKSVLPWVKKWITERLDPRQQKEFGVWARKRLLLGGKALPFEILEKLAAIKDKEFSKREEWDAWLTENRIDGPFRDRIEKQLASVKRRCTDVVLCLDARNGNTVWKVDFPGAVFKYPSSATPCVVNGFCYVIGSDGVTCCLDAKTGAEIWRAKVGDLFYNSSPLVVDDRLILFAGLTMKRGRDYEKPQEMLMALDTKTGAEKWKQETVVARSNSPVVWRHAGKDYLICSSWKNVVCVDPVDGRIVWSVPGDTTGDDIYGGQSHGHSSPVISGDHLVILGGRLLAYKLKPEGAEKIWDVDVKERGSSPLIYDGHVYAIALNRAACVKLDTGEVKWDRKIYACDFSSPIVADGKIFAVQRSGILMIEATPEKYSEIKLVKCKPTYCSSPAIVDGKLYLRLKDAVGCFDLTKKTE